MNRNLKFVVKNPIFIINFPTILQSLLLLPPSIEYKFSFLLFSQGPAQNRKGAAGAFIPQHLSLFCNQLIPHGHTYYCQKLLEGSELVPE